MPDTLKSSGSCLTEERAYSLPHLGMPTPLCTLLLKSNIRKVCNYLVKAGGDLEAKTSDGFTPLHVAAQHGHPEVSTFLAAAGADLRAQTSLGFTPLHLAAYSGHSAVVTGLVKAGADLDKMSNSLGYTPLHLAAQNGHVEASCFLVKAGADLEARSASHAYTPLHLAAQYGNVAVMEALIDAGADKETGTEGFTVAHWSAKHGQVAAVKLLIKAGSDLEARSAHGTTPLHMAAGEGHMEVMIVLIDAGVDVDRQMANGETPLHSAASKGHADAVRVLVRAKANPLLRMGLPSGRYSAPLHSAVFEVMQQRKPWLRGCCSVTGGLSALLLAAHENHVDIMTMLADAGVVDTGVALVVACRWGGEPTVSFLLRQHQKERPVNVGATSYVNAADCDGWTPLMGSIDNCRSCSPRIVRRLIDAGADATSAVRPTSTSRGNVEFEATPLALSTRCLRVKKVGGKDATEEQLNALEGIRRLLLRVEAVHAMSWLWHSNIPYTIDAEDEKRESKITSTSLRLTVPILRRRARRRGILLAPAFRWVT